MADDGDGIEGDGAHVEEHAGDVEERGEEENSLAAEEDGEEEPGEALREPPPRRLQRLPGGLALNQTEPRRGPPRRRPPSRRRMRRRWRGMPAAW